MQRARLQARLALLRALLSPALAALSVATADAQEKGARLTLRIGSDSAPQYLLTTVAGLAIRPDGAIFVLQPRESLVRAYSERGAHLFDFGRPGDGPGDFRNVSAAGWFHDTLWVADLLLGRVSIFTTEGKFLRSSRVPMPAPQLAWLRSGHLIASEGVSADRVARGEQRHIALLRWDTQAMRADTLRMLQVQNSIWKISNPGIRESPNTFLRQPFDASTLWGTSSDGTTLVIVDRDVTSRGSATFTVTKVSARGDTVFSNRLSYRPLPIDTRLVDSLVDGEAQRAMSRRMFPNLDAAKREITRSLYRPAHHPPVAQLVVGQDGTIWLRNPGPVRGARWRVLDSRGRDLGDVVTPSGLRVLAAQHGTLWGTERDELGVESVVRYAVAPPRRR